MNITKTHGYILLVVLILVAIFNRYLSIIAINILLFFDNLLNASQGISPFILWAILGLLVGIIYGSFVAWKKYILDFKLNLIPIAFLLLLLLPLFVFNDPFKNGISTGIPNPTSTSQSSLLPVDPSVSTASTNNDKKKSTLDAVRANNTNKFPTPTTESKKPPASVSQVKNYNGNIGKLNVAYHIKWLSDGTLEGTYHYTSGFRSAVIYGLKGREMDGGKIQLTEYTNGKITAYCTLKINDVCFAGQMNNTDGRHFDMKMCEQGSEVSLGSQSKPLLQNADWKTNCIIPSAPQLKQYLVGKVLCGITCNGSDEISAFVIEKPDFQKEQIVVRASFIVKDLDKGGSENCSGDYVFLKEDGACKFSKFISN